MGSKQFASGLSEADKNQLNLIENNTLDLFKWTKANFGLIKEAQAIDTYPLRWDITGKGLVVFSRYWGTGSGGLYFQVDEMVGTGEWYVLPVHEYKYNNLYLPFETRLFVKSNSTSESIQISYLLE
jgi:hypothetical protein